MTRDEFIKTGLLAAGTSLLPGATGAAAKKKSVRFAFISDIHVKPGTVPETGMAKALRHANALRPKVDFIIDGGDSIYDSLAASEEDTRIQWELYKKILKAENRLPVYNCIGNHDIFGWYHKPQNKQHPLYGKAWALKEFNLEKPYYAFKHANWNFIVLDSTHERPEGLYIAKLDDAQMEWLKSVLASIPANEYISIVSHIPILSICSGLYLNKNEENGDLRIPYLLMHTDFFALKALFNQYPNIKNCLSGHIHLQDEVVYNGVEYYCNGAISGDLWRGPFHEFEPAYAVFDFFEDGTSQRTMISYDT